MRLAERLLCLIFALVIAFVSSDSIVVPDSIVASADIIVAGDVNHDGNLNATDAALVLTHSANIALSKEKASCINGDVNHDGKTDAIDASRILHYAALVGAFEEQNAILLPTVSIPIPITIVSATSDNVDTFDIVQDNELFSTADDLFLFGHVYNSFSCLEQVQIGDIIVLWNNSVPMEYLVIKNDIGTPSWINIGGKAKTDVVTTSGESLLYNEHNRQVIRLITCKANYDYYHKRVVVAIAVE